VIAFYFHATHFNHHFRLKFEKDTGNANLINMQLELKAFYFFGKCDIESIKYSDLFKMPIK
jgi:hypothetical protein